MTAVFGALNTFLLHSGRDVFHETVSLHEAVRPAMVSCWCTGKLRLKELLQTYAVLHLQLNSIQVCTLIWHDLLRA